LILLYTNRIVSVVTGKELRDYRRRFSDTQAAFADRLGVTPNTVARWERDEMRIPESVARLILCLTRERARKARKRGC
jgi:transcriptional regulator with XRE-family HTH domain